MNTLAWIVLVIVDLALIYLLVRAVRSYRRARGKRLVTCPETNQTAAVELDATGAVIGELRGKADLHLSHCSRWPERQQCGQQCLAQIEAAPEDCLVRNQVARWFAGKPCVYCGKAIAHIDGWAEHRPALRDSEGKTILWGEIRAEKLPGLFSTCLPVCWDCHISETFRREHPELVVDRPAH